MMHFFDHIIGLDRTAYSQVHTDAEFAPAVIGSLPSDAAVIVPIRHPAKTYQSIARSWGADHDPARTIGTCIDAWAFLMDVATGRGIVTVPIDAMVNRIAVFRAVCSAVGVNFSSAVERFVHQWPVIGASDPREPFPVPTGELGTATDWYESRVLRWREG